MLEGKDNILGMFILTLVLVKSTATLWWIWLQFNNLIFKCWLVNDNIESVLEHDEWMNSGIMGYTVPVILAIIWNLTNLIF